MSTTNAIARSNQKTNVWLKDAAAELAWHDPQKACAAFRAVLHALRDRLTNKEAVQLGAQLPTFLRGIYFVL